MLHSIGRAVGVSLVGLSLVGTALAEGDKPSIEELLQAWSQRSARFPSIECKCELVEELVVGAVKPGDPFEREIPGRNKRAIYLSTKTTIGVDGDKDFLLQDGDARGSAKPSGKSQQKSWQTNDGEEVRSLTYAPAMKTPYRGSFSRSGWMKGRTAGVVDAMPFWLWYDPLAYLEAKGLDVKKLHFSDIVPKISDADNIAVRVQYPKAIDCYSEIVFENRVPYTPRRFAFVVFGQERSSLDLQYKKGADGEDMPSAWVRTALDEAGYVKSVSRGRVVSLDLSKSFDKEAFKVVFPAGTQIAVFTDDRNKPRYWIQPEEGQMRRMKSEDYGRID